MTEIKEGEVIKKDDSGKTVAMVVYGLQLLTVLTLGLAGIIGVIINYIKIDDVRGTWIESHFRWQIRTFWYSLLWWFLSIILCLILIGYFLGIIVTIWYIYRFVKGFLRLVENKPMYTDKAK